MCIGLSVPQTSDLFIFGNSISHTIAAVLLVPIAERIGSSLEEPHPRLLIMVSSFPTNVVDDTLIHARRRRPPL